MFVIVPEFGVLALALSRSSSSFCLSALSACFAASVLNIAKKVS